MSVSTVLYRSIELLRLDSMMLINFHRVRSQDTQKTTYSVCVDHIRRERRLSVIFCENNEIHIERQHPIYSLLLTS